MICEYLNACSFIRHMSKKMPFTANMMIITYCESNHDQCARYRLGKICHMEMIPHDLCPTDDTKAIKLLKSKLDESRQKLNGCTRELMSA